MGLYHKLRLFGFFRNNKYFYYRFPVELLKRALGFTNIYIVEVFFERRCPLRCTHCSSADLLSRTEIGMSLEKIRVLVDRCRKMGVVSIVYVGGEPTLRKELPEIIAITHAKKILPTIITNGWSLNEDRVEQLFDSGLANMGFSIQSMIPEVHDAVVKQPGAHKRLMHLINYCLKRGHTLSLCAVPTNETLVNGDFANLIAFAETNRIRVNLNLPAPIGHWLDQAEQILLSEESLALLERDYFHKEIVIPDFKASTGGFRFWCPMGETSLYIFPDGEVCPCTFTHISFGNIFQEPLDGIVRRMRESSLLKNLNRDGQCPIAMNNEFIQIVGEKVRGATTYPPPWEVPQEITPGPSSHPK